jgi:hypothetical protein
MTIKELSQELQVSEQALRQWCKKNNVRKERTKGRKATYVLDFDTVAQARAYYSSESKESNETNQRKESNESKESNLETAQKHFKSDIETIQSEYIESLKAQVQLLTEQLKAKDKQIADLSEQVKDFSLKLDKQQALHAGTIQTQLIDKQAPAEPTTAAATKRPAQRPRSERQQPHRKQSMLDSLLKAFRRKQA